MQKRKLYRRLLRLTALTLCAVLLCPPLSGETQAVLEMRNFTLEQAQRMAVSNSSDITRQNNELILKRMKYVEAVEGIKAKVKNLRSFRWTPLLSFKFPQQLALTEDYDLNIKPLTLQTEIDNLVHEIKDLEYAAIHTANQQYFEVYLLQETTEFTQARLDDAEVQLERNRAGLATGDATQTDVSRAERTVETLTKDLANQLREFETAKEKLSDTIGLDITVGYEFANGFKSAFISRQDLEGLTEYTLENDQAFYETKAATATALLNVEAYEDFMRGEYGSKLNYIQPYIDLAKQGMDVDYAAFQMKYREMLTALDKPWAGKMRILFFTFTMEWFKGEIDGTRYIEDEMYAVYTACMEYGNARKEQEAMEKELRGRVRDTYETLVSNWNTYLTLQEAVETAWDALERTLAMNRIGKATYTEVADEQTAYQDAQMDALDALKAYNDLLSEFDRLTCGAVTKYLKDTGMGLDTGEGGDAYALLDPIHDPYYYIYTSVADLTFYIGVSIPEGFEPAVDSFEVWYAGARIGERTDVGEELRHLTLDYQDTSTLLIRLYNGTEFVDECEIDASISRDVLDVEIEEPPPTTRVVGTYEISTSMEGGVSVSELELKVNATEGAEFYTLSYGEQGIYTTDQHRVRESFHYLTLLIASLDEVTGTLYDRSGNELITFRFDPVNQELFTDLIEP